MKEETEALQNLMQALNDCVEMYSLATDKIEHDDILAIVRDLEENRKKIIEQLQPLLDKKESETGHTVTGVASLQVAQVLSAVSSNIDKTLVSHLEYHEFRILDKVAKVLEVAKSPDIISTLQKIYPVLQGSNFVLQTIKGETT